MIDLNELELKIDRLLQTETKESLLKFLKSRTKHTINFVEDDWIKIEDELPPFDLKVLIYGYPTHPIMEGRTKSIDYRREYDHLPKHDQTRKRLEENLGFFYHVTHWQYLPDNPKY